MPDNLTKKRPQDAKRVNLSQPYEIKYWCWKWDCTEKELRQAVKAVGDSAAKVGQYLTGH